VLREDFEALLNDVRDEPDQRPLEREMCADAETVIAEYDDADALHDERDLVEARIVHMAFAALEQDATA
jgi:hypothetical protein